MEILPNKLLQILSHPDDISSENQEILEKAIVEHPYFQLARTLVAKAKHDQQAPDAYESLGDAAIYAPDRRHLRKVFYDGIHIDWQPVEEGLSESTSSDTEEKVVDKGFAVAEPTASDPAVETLQSPEEATTTDFTPETDETTEAHHSEEPITADHTAEETQIAEKSESDEPGLDEPSLDEPSLDEPGLDEPGLKKPNSDEAEVESFKPNSTQIEDSVRPEDETKESGVANHDLEEEIVYQELEENLRKLRQAKEEAQQDEAEKKKITNNSETSSKATSTRSSSSIDYLHDAEPTSSEHLDVHQQQQNELINKFVNSDTDSIGRLRSKASDNTDETSDLSEKSATYDDDLVTENLAEIMQKQGKQEKAIEIYQQLKLKFPEKKAYFAEKIEKLNEI